MELNLTLNTANSQVTYKSDKLNGYLNSIIIDSDDKIEIIVESILGYLILHRSEVYGIKYFCPRAATTLPEDKLIDVNGKEKFCLNEEIFITIIGPKNKDVNIILKID